MYTDTNYKTKKALKEAVKAWADYEKPWPGTVGAVLGGSSPPAVTTHQPGGMFAPTLNGRATIEGPHYPEPHRWYASVELKDGYIVKVLS